jgi:hypothetical protein
MPCFPLRCSWTNASHLEHTGREFLPQPNITYSKPKVNHLVQVYFRIGIYYKTNYRHFIDIIFRCCELSHLRRDLLVLFYGEILSAALKVHGRGRARVPASCLFAFSIDIRYLPLSDHQALARSRARPHELAAVAVSGQHFHFFVWLYSGLRPLDPLQVSRQRRRQLTFRAAGGGCRRACMWNCQALGRRSTAAAKRCARSCVAVANGRIQAELLEAWRKHFPLRDG